LDARQQGDGKVLDEPDYGALTIKTILITKNFLLIFLTIVFYFSGQVSSGGEIKKTSPPPLPRFTREILGYYRSGFIV
jgi:hypothetical protein